MLALPLTIAAVNLGNRRRAFAVHLGIAAWIRTGRGLACEDRARSPHGFICLRNLHRRNTRVTMAAPRLNDCFTARGARDRHEAQRLRLRRSPRFARIRPRLRGLARRQLQRGSLAPQDSRRVRIARRAVLVGGATGAGAAGPLDVVRNKALFAEPKHSPVRLPARGNAGPVVERFCRRTRCVLPRPATVVLSLRRSS